MSKSTRSIKDSIGGAAFDFVKQGFEEPRKTSAASQPKKNKPASSESEKRLAVVSHEEKPKSVKPKSTTPRKKTTAAADENTHRVPVSTRMKAGLVAEIKREGLRRQLAGDSVCTMQGILEQAAEDWLKRNSTA